MLHLTSGINFLIHSASSVLINLLRSSPIVRDSPWVQQNSKCSVPSTLTLKHLSTLSTGKHRGRLCTVGIPDVLTDLVADLHEKTRATIRVGKNKSARLETTSGVRWGCILAPALFCVAIDWILKYILSKPTMDIGSSSFSDLVYAEDTVFFVKNASDATDCLTSFSQSFSVFGLRAFWAKTKLQSVGSDSGPDVLSVMVGGNSVDPVESFTSAASKHLTASHVE